MPEHVPMWAIVVVAAVAAFMTASGGLVGLARFSVQFAFAFAMVLTIVLVVTAVKRWLFAGTY